MLVQLPCSVMHPVKQGEPDGSGPILSLTKSTKVAFEAQTQDITSPDLGQRRTTHPEGTIPDGPTDSLEVCNNSECLLSGGAPAKKGTCNSDVLPNSDAVLSWTEAEGIMEQTEYFSPFLIPMSRY